MPKHYFFVASMCASIAACSGEHGTSTRSLDRSSRSDAAPNEDSEAVDAAVEESDARAEGVEGTGEVAEPDAATSDAGSSDAGSSDAAANGAGSSDASSDAGSVPDARPGNVDGERSDAQTPDGPSDSGAEAAAPLPSYSALFRPGLALGVLPESVASLATTPVSSEERAQAGASEYQVVTTELLAPDAPRTDPEPGLNSWVLVRWGFISNAAVPAGAPAWRDFSGYIALAEGSIELQRAVRWVGPAEPSEPPPVRDVVAVQTDPRVLRFSSQLGSGSAGVLLHLHRSRIEPNVVVIALSNATRYYPFENFLASKATSGGWSMALGQGLVSSERPGRSAGCYGNNGTLVATASYRASPSTALMALNGTLTRGDGSTELLALSAGELVGPYGALSGTLGSGAQVQGYFGRDWIFADYDRQGIVLLQVTAPGASEAELVFANYERTRISSGKAFRSIDCGAPGAVSSSPLSP